MAEEKKKVDAKFTEACFLVDYIDIISEFGQDKNPAGYKNFKVIMSYNPSTFYAMVVSELSEKISQNK